MKNHYKVFGNPDRTNFEISFDLSRWLIGFSWTNLNTLRFKQRLSIYLPIGPLAFFLTIK